jgi:hypothetical protein
MIFPIAWAGTGRQPCGRTRVQLLEFPRYLMGSMFSRRERSGKARNHHRDDDRADSRHRQYRQYPVNHNTASVVSIADAKMRPSVLRA